jgi:glutaredoxin-related protein
MPRPVLPEAQIHPAIRPLVAGFNASIIGEVQLACEAHPVLVVGMAGNPWCRRARRALQAAGVQHRYVEYGSYFRQWRRRTALKMWTGWPTFPMVFVKGHLIGGSTDLDKLIASGELQRML